MERYVCIHGHFYQPPRENAWLESIELQDSAYPYHDWNERITAECYAPNAASRILNGEGYINQIVNNYSRISFNFGPTLLAWLKNNAADVYQAIQEADRQSQKTFAGHGSALAQAYSHMIMPLANRRDKYTQVRWGIRDFEHHFGRQPKGMWLPETAVDLETLEILAEMGLKFTILAPHQAGRVRRIGAKDWHDVSDSQIDPSRAYLVRLPSGRTLNLFFYDGPISRQIAFEDILSSGENFANRLTEAFNEERTWPQLVHIATDGETYGHHHRFGDMALSFALHYIEGNETASTINYGAYLEKHPPTHEVEIMENTSWSCAHGIERWRSDCGCTTGGHPKWNQAWRAPLREALDWLRDTVTPAYEEKARQFFQDPWATRDAYIQVILDRSVENVSNFLKEQSGRELNDEETVTALKLLELQRHAMLIFTSCGWFFDELSRIETVQVIQYAGRVVQLAQDLLGNETEAHFLDIMARAKSNIAEHGDGRRIYEKWVKPAMVDLLKVTAHYAISSLFEQYEEDEVKVHCYSVRKEDYQTTTCGKAKLAVGKVRITSDITREGAVVSFGVLHFGDHNVNAGVRHFQGEEAYKEMVRETSASCAAADFPEALRLLDKHFGTSTYSLRSLFRDEQRKVLGYILESTMSEIESAYRQLYEHHFPSMRFLVDLGGPVPKAFHSAAELIVNIDLHRAVSAETFDAGAVQTLLDNAKVWQVEIDADGLAYEFKQTLEKMTSAFVSDPGNKEQLDELVEAVSMAGNMPFPVNLWKVQNQYWEMLHTVLSEYQEKARAGDAGAAEWVECFGALGEALSIRSA